MKKLIGKFTVLMLACTMLAGCATITNGHITDCQKTKPAPGQPHRHIKVWALVCDGPLGLVIDFCDGAIWKKGNCGK